ncbi:unnamed protein product [Psylliodes chrysocephalus]|uniref:Large ribosomal subunit protein mL40 n=1 Tax=Psylliodes chrysocephalus TaxID=3402493 RepID=A0A9P0D188_9CUCU|nr:unnamed protein product [Psylliodes chrysocephala]
MSINNLVSSLTRLSLIKVPTLIRNVSLNAPMLFRSTPVLLAEPLKKKKKMDPAIIKAREEKKKKKIEKAIRKLEKNARKLKPISECEIPFEILDTLKNRQRNLPGISEEILENRALLEKKWCRYKREQHLVDMQMLDRIQFAQQKALDELRKESEQLYQEAIQPDLMMMPYKIEGPVETPPIENYQSPDGDYNDVSKKW